MDNSGSAVRTNQPRNLLARTRGRFCSTDRIQKLLAPARELIQSASTLKRLFDFLVRAKQPRRFENARKLKPRFMEYWREACELIREAILARYRLFVRFGFQRLRLVKKENPVEARAGLLLKPKYGNDPPKGFVPLPDAEIGGCARNDSLIASAI